MEGFDEAREEWERQYAEARTRWEEHGKQIAERVITEAPAKPAEGEAAPKGDKKGGKAPEKKSAPAEPQGTLATDEALAALREKLAGN
jgi:small subunit ribosomal protein S1